MRRKGTALPPARRRACDSWTRPPRGRWDGERPARPAVTARTVRVANGVFAPFVFVFTPVQRTTLVRFWGTRSACFWSGHDQVLWKAARGVVGCTLPRRLTSEDLGPLAELVARLTGDRGRPRTVVVDASRVASEGCDRFALAGFRRRVAIPLA